MRVLLACPGLDHARRGFETFARSCFEALHGDPRLEIELVKGSGPRAPDERSIPTLLRDTTAARLLSRATNRPSFAIEHLAFSASLSPLLLARRPDVVYFSEWHVGRALALWRKATRQRYRLVLCNGTSSPGPYDHLDLVQQLTPGALQHVLDCGADPERNVLLPYGFHIDPELRPLSADDRPALRARLELPARRRIVISVAALNRQKRIDYLIEEVAALPEPRPFLLLLGQVEEETPPLRELAEATLGVDGYAMRTVPHEDVRDHLRASDVFVLGSLWEALPLALVEGMTQGLACVAHRFPPMRFVIGDHGYIADLERPGVLRGVLAGIDDADLTPATAAERHRSVYERLSWDALRPGYVDLFRRALEVPLAVLPRDVPNAADGRAVADG